MAGEVEGAAAVIQLVRHQVGIASDLETENKLISPFPRVCTCVQELNSVRFCASCEYGTIVC